MKKILLALAFAALMVSGVASANNAAVVIMGSSCGVLDGNGGFAIAQNTHSVRTNSANGNAMFACKTDVEPPVSGKAVTYSFESTGQTCGLATIDGFVSTENWHETVSAKGKVTLVCHAP